MINSSKIALMHLFSIIIILSVGSISVAGKKLSYSIQNRSCDGDWSHFLPMQINTSINYIQNLTFQLDWTECKWNAMLLANCNVLSVDTQAKVCYCYEDLNGRNFSNKIQPNWLYWEWICTNQSELCEHSNHKHRCKGFFITYPKITLINSRPYQISNDTHSERECLSNSVCNMLLNSRNYLSLSGYESSHFQFFADLTPYTYPERIHSSGQDHSSLSVWHCCNQRQPDFDPLSISKCYTDQTTLEFKPCRGKWHPVDEEFMSSRSYVVKSSFFISTTSMCECVISCAESPLCVAVNMNPQTNVCSQFNFVQSSPPPPPPSFEARAGFGSTQTSWSYYWQCHAQELDLRKTYVSPSSHVRCIRSKKEGRGNHSQHPPAGSLRKKCQDAYCANQVTWTPDQYFYLQNNENVTLLDGLGGVFYLMEENQPNVAIGIENVEIYADYVDLYSCKIACGIAECDFNSSKTARINPSERSVLPREVWSAQLRKQNVQWFTKPPQIVEIHDVLDYQHECQGYHECVALLRFIQQYDLQRRMHKYADIAFHYAITSNGTVFECRSNQLIGAHDLSINYNSLGIIFLNHLTGRQLPSHAAAQAFQSLLEYLTTLGRLETFYQIQVWPSINDSALQWMKTWAHFDQPSNPSFCSPMPTLIDLESILMPLFPLWAIIGCMIGYVLAFCLIKNANESRKVHSNICCLIRKLTSFELYSIQPNDPFSPHMSLRRSEFYICHSPSTRECQCLLHLPLHLWHYRKNNTTATVLDLISQIKCFESSLLHLFVVGTPSLCENKIICLLVHSEDKPQVEEIFTSRKVCLCKELNIHPLQVVKSERKKLIVPKIRSKLTFEMLKTREFRPNYHPH